MAVRINARVNPKVVGIGSNGAEIARDVLAASVSGMGKVKIVAFPEGHNVFAGFVESKETPWYSHFWKKLFTDHITFQADYQDQRVTVWLKTESVRETLGIGSDELKAVAKLVGNYSRLGGWWHDTTYHQYLDPLLELVRTSGPQETPSEEILHLLEGRMACPLSSEMTEGTRRKRMSREEFVRLYGWWAPRRRSLPHLRDGDTPSTLFSGIR